MQMVTTLRCMTEDEIAHALASLSPASWPQDEKDLLILFNRLLDMNVGNHIRPGDSVDIHSQCLSIFESVLVQKYSPGR